MIILYEALKKYIAILSNSALTGLDWDSALVSFGSSPDDSHVRSGLRTSEQASLWSLNSHQLGVQDSHPTEQLSQCPHGQGDDMQ